MDRAATYQNTENKLRSRYGPAANYGTKMLHELGYSHGDLKPENICARKRQSGEIVFTLIDFGLCQKLP